MGRRKDILPTMVSQIVLLHEQGFTQKAISQRFGISRIAVQQRLARYHQTGSYTSARRSGRPRSTSLATDRVIRRIAVADPTASSSFIAAQLPEETPVSCRTVRRRLQKDFGLRAYRPACTPRLSPKNVRDRLAFAKRYRHWTTAQWSQVMFSDESLIKQFYSFSNHVRRPVRQRFNARYTVPRVKNSPSTMIWGAITAAGRGPLWFMPANSTITAAVYLDMLKKKLPYWLRHHNSTIFQHDGAPAHNAKSVKSWLVEQSIDLLAPWPGSSPDLNPIENCWAVLKKNVAALKPTSQSDLHDKIKRVWCQEITADYCAALINSMPARLEAVIQAKGGPTKY